MMMRQEQQGFTLVELLLYVAVLSTVFLTASVLLTTMLNARARQIAAAEVNETGEHVMRIITQTVRNAESITSPAAGASASSATIDVVNAGDDPTIFDLSSGTLRIREGAPAATAITSNRVTISNLTFTNMTAADTPGSLRIQFTATYTNPDNLKYFEFERTFYATASLRQP